MKAINLILCLLVLPMLLIAQETGKEAVVAPVKMNILYRGMDNPLEIAVPGVASDKVTATMTNGTIKKVTNGWIATPGSQSESVIAVMVDNKKISEKNFRIKNVPDPIAVFAGKYDGNISKDVALKTEMVEVELRNFDWDLKFTLRSFVLTIMKNNMDIVEEAQGNRLTDKMKSLIAECKPGQKIIFKNITAVGPDGKPRELNPIVLTIN